MAMADTKLRIHKATAVLREDHRKVKKLFSEYEKLGKKDENEKRELFETIKQELTIHSQLEEELFYPPLAATQEEELRELVFEAREEHQIVKTLLADLSNLTPDEE